MSDISFMVDHTKFFGELLWDIVAVLFLIGVVVFFFVRRRQMKKKQNDLEDEIAEVYAENGNRGSY